MRSLKALATVNWILAVLYVGLGAFLLFMVDRIATATANKVNSGGDTFLLFGGIAGGFILVSVIVHGWVALGLPDGRGRVLQTVLAVLHAANFPLGTAYAAWAGWLCWLNPETARAFEQPRLEHESDDQWADRLAAGPVEEDAPAELPPVRRPPPRRVARTYEPEPAYDDEEERTEPRGRPRG